MSFLFRPVIWRRVGERLLFHIDLIEKKQSAERSPHEGLFELTVPSVDFENIMWRVKQQVDNSYLTLPEHRHSVCAGKRELSSQHLDVQVCSRRVFVI